MIKLGKAFNHKIEITSSANKCYILQIGCATLSYNEVGPLLNDLEEYLHNPGEVEREYNKSIHGYDSEVGPSQPCEQPYEQPTLRERL